MDPDMNKYDLEHVVDRPFDYVAGRVGGRLSRAWERYYSPEHVET